MNNTPTFDDLENKHKGETCIIAGNGPTLRDVPISFLANYWSFGTNRIYLHETFEPNYYVAVNPLVIKQFRDDIINRIYTATKFIMDPFDQVIPGSIGLKDIGTFCFSYNPRVGIHQGWTVTYVCLQLAYFMGFTTVYLVGVGHRYAVPGKVSGGTRIKSKGPDPNHFSEDYFGKGIEWHAPDLKRSERAYELARQVYEATGRKVINLTPGTALDVFEKRNMEEIINGE